MPHRLCILDNKFTCFRDVFVTILARFRQHGMSRSEEDYKILFQHKYLPLIDVRFAFISRDSNLDHESRRFQSNYQQQFSIFLSLSIILPTHEISLESSGEYMVLKRTELLLNLHEYNHWPKQYFARNVERFQNIMNLFNTRHSTVF